MRKETECGSNWGGYYFGFEKRIVKRFVQCYVFVQSPSDRRPSDKYPVNTSHHSRVVLKCVTRRIIWSQCQSLRSHMCVCVYTHTHMFCTV
jgi:hypothetical protein